MAENHLFSVLTGDIVGSTKLNIDNKYKISNVLRSTTSKISKYFQYSIHSNIDIFRGDSWQMVITTPKKALRIGLLLRALLISEPGYNQLDTRFSIGFGTIDYLPDNQISIGNGEAFYLSGKGLESLRKNNNMCLNFSHTIHSSTTQALNVIVRLIDLHVLTWTKKQSEAVAGALVGLTQREIADTWVEEPVSQQAISQHLESAGWAQINDGIEYFEITFPTLFETNY